VEWRGRFSTVPKKAGERPKKPRACRLHWGALCKEIKPKLLTFNFEKIQNGKI
jgi:hypothetical protein